MTNPGIGGRGCAEGGVPIKAVAGPVSSGKTRRLVAEVTALLESGVPAEEILVITGTREGAGVIKGDLRVRTARPSHELPRVTASRELQFDLIRAHEGAGSPRVLLEVQKAILVMDLKARGILPEDIAAGLKAIDQGVDAAPGQPVYEVTVAIQRELDLLGAILPAQLPRRAMDAVRAAGSEGGSRRWTYVFIDDANAMSAASIELGAMLATGQVTLFGDPSWAPRIFDTACDPQAFVRMAPGQVEYLVPWVGGDPSREGACGFVGSSCLKAGKVDLVKWDGPEDEFLGICQAVRHALDDIAAREDQGEAVNPSDVVIVAPQASWVPIIRRQLGAAAIATSAFMDVQPIGGDPRKPASCQALLAYARLGVLADSGDVASWRTLAAIGKGDLAARAWVAFEDWAAGQGLGLPQAINELPGLVDGGAAPFQGADALAASISREARHLDGLKGKRGHGLLGCVTTSVDSVITEVAGTLGEDGASELAVRLHDACIDRGFPGTDLQVRVCQPQALTGCRPAYVIMAGQNDGLVPDAKAVAKPAVMDFQRAMFRDCVGRAADGLIIGYQRFAPLESAERSGLAISRTRATDEGEVACLKLSPFISELGAGRPSSVSGQQFRANLR